MRIASQRDFAAGLLYLGVGSAFAIGALGYRLGTPARMGAGYFPLWLGIILAALGLVVLIGAFRPSTETDRLDRWDLRGLLFVLAGVVLFGLLLPGFGLVIAVAVLVAVSSFAVESMSWRLAAANVVALSAVSVLLFVYALGLPFPVWPVGG